MFKSYTFHHILVRSFQWPLNTIVTEDPISYTNPALTICFHISERILQLFEWISVILFGKNLTFLIIGLQNIIFSLKSFEHVFFGSFYNH